MSSCCTPTAHGADGCAVPYAEEIRQNAALIQHCPVCGKKGKGVDSLTVKSMLAVSLHTIRASGYGFCHTAECPVVYFARDREQTLTESDLRVPVHQKHPGEDVVFVCYCFRHTPGSIRAEIMASGQSTVVETVTRGTQTDQCACEIRNPQGSCCLGNVRETVQRVMGELEAVAVEV